MTETRIIEGDIPAGQVTEHEGPVHVTGSLGDGARLIVTNGSVTIDGDVGQNCEVEARVPGNASSFSITGGSGINIINGTVIVGNGTVISGSGSRPPAFVRIAGPVGDDSKVKAADAVELSSIGTGVSVTGGDEVTLTGAAGDKCTVTAGDSLKGQDFGSGCVLEAGDSMRIGSTGRNCQIEAGDSLHAASLGERTTASAGDSARVAEAHANVRLSAGDDLDVDAAHQSARLSAGDDVTVGRRFNDTPAP